jgi:NAD(P)H dehydrogenase (quinone)
MGAGVQRIVHTSWPDPGLYPLPLMAHFADSEALLRSLPPGTTILRTMYRLAQTVARDMSTVAAADRPGDGG